VRALVCIPTYNEAPNIHRVLPRVRAAVPDATILVIDDGSPDGTADLAEALGGELGQVEVLRRTEKQGLGAAYRAGFAWGLAHGFDVLVEMDADLSHDPDALPELLAAIDDGATLAIGSRWVEGGMVVDWPRERLLLSRLGNFYARVGLQLPVRDATGGFRAYRAEVLREIDLSVVRSNGYAFQVEMAYRVLHLGGRIIEVPITFRERTEGVSKMSWHIIGEALKLVTAWGARDRLRRLTGRGRRPQPAPAPSR
jgi:dolichol-phosphate mannosyltransferase